MWVRPSTATQTSVAAAVYGTAVNAKPRVPRRGASALVLNIAVGNVAEPCAMKEEDGGAACLAGVPVGLDQPFYSKRGSFCSGRLYERQMPKSAGFVISNIRLLWHWPKLLPYRLLFLG